MKFKGNLYQTAMVYQNNSLRLKATIKWSNFRLTHINFFKTRSHEHSLITQNTIPAKQCTSVRAQSPCKCKWCHFECINFLGIDYSWKVTFTLKGLANWLPDCKGLFVTDLHLRMPENNPASVLMPDSKYAGLQTGKAGGQPQQEVGIGWLPTWIFGMRVGSESDSCHK